MSYDKLEDLSQLSKGLFFTIAPNLVLHKLTCDEKDCGCSYKDLAKECVEASEAILERLGEEEHE